MMRWVLYLSVVMIVSCGSKTDVPKGILPVKEMQMVMWDMIRADMMVNNQFARDTNLHKLDASTALYQQIFKIHHITKEEFKRSVQFYKVRPDLLQPIYDSLYNKSTAIPVIPPPPPPVKAKP